MMKDSYIEKMLTDRLILRKFEKQNQALLPENRIFWDRILRIGKRCLKPYFTLIPGPSLASKLLKRSKKSNYHNVYYSSIAMHLFEAF